MALRIVRADRAVTASEPRAEPPSREGSGVGRSLGPSLRDFAASRLGARLNGVAHRPSGSRLRRERASRRAAEPRRTWGCSEPGPIPQRLRGFAAWRAPDGVAHRPSRLSSPRERASRRAAEPRRTWGWSEPRPTPQRLRGFAASRPGARLNGVPHRPSGSRLRRERASRRAAEPRRTWGWSEPGPTPQRLRGFAASRATDGAPHRPSRWSLHRERASRRAARESLAQSRRAAKDLGLFGASAHPSETSRPGAHQTTRVVRAPEPRAEAAGAGLAPESARRAGPGAGRTPESTLRVASARRRALESSGPVGRNAGWISESTIRARPPRPTDSRVPGAHRT
jgi:hypothetical protein